MKGLAEFARQVCCPALIAVICCGTVVESAWAQSGLPDQSLVYDNMVALRYNPIGLEDQLRVAYQYRLWEKEGILWDTAYAGVALTPSFNPAVTRLGARLEIQPLALLMLHAGAYWVGWHGTFDYLQSFPSVKSEHSDDVLKDGTDAGLNYATTGSQFVLGGRLQAKVGPVAIRDTFDFFWSRNDLHAGDRVFYDPRLDVLVGNGGWHVENDLDVIWMGQSGWLAGARGHISHAWYDDTDRSDSDDGTDNPNTPSMRLGLIGGYIFNTDTGPMFQKPTVLVIVNWYLAHRYRDGSEVSQALPYIGIAFRFGGTFWSTN